MTTNREFPTVRHIRSLRELYQRAGIEPKRMERYCPRARWGEPVYRGDHGGTRHLQLRMDWAPESQLVTARCLQCGARHLREIDLCGLSSHPDALANATLPVLSPLLEIWTPQHQRCRDDVPELSALPSPLQSFVRAGEEDARKKIGRGQPVRSRLSLFAADGSAHHFRLEEVSAPDALERRIRQSEAAFLVRAYARRLGLEPIGAMHVGEAWIHSPQPLGLHRGVQIDPRQAQRDEGVMYTIVTPTHGWMALSPIRRMGGCIGKGPGTIDPIEALATVEWSWVDSVLTTPQAHSSAR